jgi:hypothetical protein
MNTNLMKQFLTKVVNQEFGQTKMTQAQVDAFFKNADDYALRELSNYMNDWSRRGNQPYANEISDLDHFVLQVAFS